MNLKHRVLLAALDSGTSNTLTLFKAGVAMETFAKLVLKEFAEQALEDGFTIEEINKKYEQILKQLK